MSTRTHTTILRHNLSEHPDLRPQSNDQDKPILFEKDIGPALKKACEYDTDAIHLVRAIQLVRREMFETRLTFNGVYLHAKRLVAC